MNMLQNPWSSGRATVIVLPSGQRGTAILEFAELWAKNSLIGPAIWVLPTEIHDAQGDEYVSLVVGRNDSRKVDLFAELGRKELELVRLLVLKIVDTEGLVDEKQAQLSRRLVNELEASRPQPWGSKDQMKGTVLTTINLVVAATGTQDLDDQNLFEAGWNRNVVAAPEDRATPAGFSKSIKWIDTDHVNAFGLLHAVAATGIFAGHSEGPYDLVEGESSAYAGKVFVQRAYARAITGDAAAARLTAKALKIAAGVDISKRLSYRQHIKDLEFLSSTEQADYLNKAVTFARKLDGGALAVTAAEPGEFGAKDKISVGAQIKEFGLFMGTLIWQAPFWIRTGVLDSLGRSLTRTFRESGDSVTVDAHIDANVDRSDMRMMVGLAEYENLKLQITTSLTDSSDKRSAVARPRLWIELGDLVFRLADGSTENPQMKQTDGSEPAQILTQVDFIAPEPNATWHPPKQAADEVVSFAEYSVVWSNEHELDFVNRQLNDRERHFSDQIDALNAKVYEARDLAHQTLGVIGQAENDAATFDQDQSWALIGADVEVDWLSTAAVTSAPNGDTPDVASIAEEGATFEAPSPEAIAPQEESVSENYARMARDRNIEKLRNLNIQIRQWVGTIDDLAKQRDRVLSVQHDLHDWVKKKRESFSGLLLGAIHHDIQTASDELASAASSMSEVRTRLRSYWVKARTSFVRWLLGWFVFCVLLFIALSAGAIYLLEAYALAPFGLDTPGRILLATGLFALLFLVVCSVGLLISLYKRFAYVRGQINEGIAKGRWFLERIAYLKNKRDELEFLLPKVENFLGFMVEGLRHPWTVSEELLEVAPKSVQLISAVPYSFQVAEPVDDGFDEKVEAIALGQVVRKGWRRKAFQQRLDLITQDHGLDRHSANDVFRDETVTGVRQICFDEFKTPNYLDLVAQEEIKQRRADVFSQILREDLRPRVRVSQRDPLLGLVTSNDPFAESSDDLVDWDGFLGALTGLTTPFAANTFSLDGIREQHHTQVRSIFFGDKRLVSENQATGIEYRKLEDTLNGIAEVTYRVDISEPLDPKDTALLSKVLYSATARSSKAKEPEFDYTADVFI